jgi:hypothetical protein
MDIVVRASWTHPHDQSSWCYDLQGVGVVVSDIGPEQLASGEYVAVPAGWYAGSSVERCRLMDGVWSEGTVVRRDTAGVHPPISGPRLRLCWPDTPSFPRMTKTTWKRHSWIRRSDDVLEFRAKVKVHGMHAAVQVLPDGTVLAQDRYSQLSLDNDRRRFAVFVDVHKGAWAQLPAGVVYGEWCGKGINRLDAVTQLPERHFCIFAFARQTGNREATWQAATDPAVLRRILEPVLSANVHVLPWAGPSMHINVTRAKRGGLLQLKTLVASIAEQDPWVLETFGVSGKGEGAVVYPVSHDGADFMPWYRLHASLFKAKHIKRQRKRAEVEA